MRPKAFLQAAVVVACAGCSSGTGTSADFPAAAFSTTMTDSAAMRVELRTSPQPPTRGGIDAELTFTDAASGAPRDGLTLQVQPWMPAMNHGAIKATVTPEGNGKYLVTEIDRDRYMPGLTAAIRIYIVDFYRKALAAGPSEAVSRPVEGRLIESS